MTREEVKRLLPILQAFAEGETIQKKGIVSSSDPFYINDERWITACEIDIPYFIKNLKDYRIVPKSKYRPFKNAKECWQEMQKHQPFGWVMPIDEVHYRFIGSIENEGLLFADHKLNCSTLSFDGALRWITFADGASFGIKED